MPAWVPYKRLASLACGLWLFGWGTLVLLGWQLRWAAQALGAFLVVVTLAVHVPGVVAQPVFATEEATWMWDILQRTNLVKNICLLGVCFHLLHHRLGKYSLARYLGARK